MVSRRAWNCPGKMRNRHWTEEGSGRISVTRDSCVALGKFSGLCDCVITWPDKDCEVKLVTNATRSGQGHAKFEARDAGSIHMCHSHQRHQILRRRISRERVGWLLVTLTTWGNTRVHQGGRERGACEGGCKGSGGGRGGTEIRLWRLCHAL